MMEKWVYNLGVYNWQKENSENADVPRRSEKEFIYNKKKL